MPLISKFRRLLHLKDSSGAGSNAAPKPENPFEALRAHVFQRSPAEVGIEPTPAHPNLWGMVMELGLGSGVATIVSLVDGTTSMYFSSGGGVIGAGGHEHVRNASSRFVQIGEEFLPRFRATDAFPVPNPEQVVFYALTFDGSFVAQAPNEELMAERSELTPLFGAGQDVVTALRTIPTETDELSR